MVKLDWHLIETAPQDGTPVLVWKADERRVGEYMLVAYFDQAGPFAGHWVACGGGKLGYYSDWEDAYQGYPSHWAELPSTPEDGNDAT